MSIELVGYTGNTRVPSIGQVTATNFPTWVGVLIGTAAGYFLTRKSTRSYSSLMVIGGLGILGYIIAKDLQTQP